MMASMTAPQWPSHTQREIHQQPDVWIAAMAGVDAVRADLNAWLAPILARPDLRIILTGAGSSAYIGEALAPVLTEGLQRTVTAISTTSLVGAPAGHLLADRPTLLVSYARSGNSPESLAAVELADHIVGQCYHLVLCCNPDSELVQASKGLPNRRTLLMPPAALDQSFAMTSSFTSMLVSTLHLFLPDHAQAMRTIDVARALLSGRHDDIDAIIGEGFDRLVFLGSGSLQGIATEAALKALELSAGASVAASESSLGFRHGPKFLVDEGTVVVTMPSGDPYTSRYDSDLIAELDRDGVARRVVRLDTLPAVVDLALAPQWLGLVYLIWCQLLACRNAEAMGINPDNPCPSGEVNRVVQGVTIHPFTPSAITGAGA